MSFNSLDYLIFMLAVLALYWVMPRRAQNYFLLAASYFFYGYVHPWFLILILVITGANYLTALGMQRRPEKKKALLTFAAVISLGMLGFFKYWGFFTENLSALAHGLGLGTLDLGIAVFLPVGISFYTFQALGYSVDVYRGDIEARSDFCDFALFVSFFPQLVAGPIERAGNLLPQVENDRTLTLDAVRGGLILLLWGFFQKMVVADNVAPVVDKIFILRDPGFPLVWTGALAFSVQILADFAAYTNIARGTARLLGFELIRNFDHPYLSVSPADFWRRWHMSLSYWLRDYVYIPLGGSRVSRARGSLNIMITFLASGLWHGAQWNFVLWGAYHGVLVLAHRWWVILAPGADQPRAWTRPFRVAGTFLLVLVGWLMFRETDLHWLVKMFSANPLAASAREYAIASHLLGTTLIYASPMVLASFLGRLMPRLQVGRVGSTWASASAQALAACLIFVGILTLRALQSSSFIYFQF